MMKKWLAMLLVLTMAIGMIPASAMAAGTLTITKEIPGVSNTADVFEIQIQVTGGPSDGWLYRHEYASGEETNMPLIQNTENPSAYSLWLADGEKASIPVGNGYTYITRVSEILAEDSIYMPDQQSYDEFWFGGENEDQTLEFINRFQLAAAVVEPKDPSGVPYNGEDQNPEVVVKVNGEEIPASEYDVVWYREGDVGGTPVTPKDAGRYIGMVTARDNSGCTGTARQHVSFEISPAPVIISAESLTKMVGDKLPEAKDFTVSASGLQGEDKLQSVTLSLPNVHMSQEGTYAVILSNAVLSGNASNYTLTYTEGTLNVVKPAYTRARFVELKVDGDLTGMEQLDSEAEIKAALTLEVTGEDGYTADRISFYDMIVEYSLDNINWYPFNTNNFPADGVKVCMDYPAGTNKDDFDFRVVHMFANTVDRLDITAGKVEIPDVEKRSDGIWFLVKGMSPVAVGDQSAKGGSGDTSASVPGGSAPGDPLSDPSLPKTGDDARLWLWTALCLVSLGAIGLIIRRRKHA